jgi:hypothetical protein
VNPSAPVRALALIALAALALRCGGVPAPAFTRLDSARKLAAHLRLHFNKAAGAADRAVMADTDEASIAYARDAEQAAKVVESDIAALAPLLRDLGYPKEVRLFAEFGNQYAEYEKLARDILSLAVENTNLKAQRLSFGPGSEAADAFRDALASIPEGAVKDRYRIESLVAQATLAVREIQVLQAPHIAEPDDAAMTRIEQQMSALAVRARHVLDEIAEPSGPKPPPGLERARAALDRFEQISSQILKMSRQNTNVRSLELALREKPALTAACDDRLRLLQDTLDQEGSKATR